jgi:DNA/RNA endonuclease YhcR with UshA esterase domain
MKKSAIRLIALGGFLVSGVQLQAHHAVAGVYDLNKEIVLEGTLQKLNYRNPHANIILDVPNDDGSITEWTLTTASTQALSQRGVDRDTIKPGEALRVTALPARNGNPSGFIRRIELSDREFNFGIE